jgi:hypothetical protein
MMWQSRFIAVQVADLPQLRAPTGFVLRLW